jgi:acyl-phosphate glycerol 3-phosphate acyltransferase
MQNILWLIVSYLLGSIPSGFLVSNLSGKDILNIGWRKTSGSNVFMNVGKTQGVLTAFMDIFKGFLAVYGAQKLGLTLEFQVYSGVLAVVGNNWSVFLKFAGGRGLGTYGGALFAFSPQAFLIALSILVLGGIIWDAAISTFFTLAGAVYFSLQSQNFESVGLLTLFCLIPIFLKRLSPFKELSFQNPKLFFSRLIFDDDHPHGFRIKRIIGRMRKV